MRNSGFCAAVIVFLTSFVAANPVFPTMRPNGRQVLPPLRFPVAAAGDLVIVACVVTKNVAFKLEARHPINGPGAN